MMYHTSWSSKPFSKPWRLFWRHHRLPRIRSYGLRTTRAGSTITCSPTAGEQTNGSPLTARSRRPLLRSATYFNFVAPFFFSHCSALSCTIRVRTSNSTVYSNGSQKKKTHTIIMSLSVKIPCTKGSRTPCTMSDCVAKSWRFSHYLERVSAMCPSRSVNHGLSVPPCERSP